MGEHLRKEDVKEFIDGVELIGQTVVAMCVKMTAMIKDRLARGDEVCRNCTSDLAFEQGAMAVMAVLAKELRDRFSMYRSGETDPGSEGSESADVLLRILRGALESPREGAPGSDEDQAGEAPEQEGGEPPHEKPKDHLH